MVREQARRDTGIWYYHPDLYYNVDFASSASMVPGEPDFLNVDGHGSHVAGIVAAADNGFGTIGVAPNATLIGVKVFAANGQGNASWIMNGIIHSVLEGADIINLSLGSY
ncbi:MAG: S8 family serine peptidase [bacterium]|nr:S8 family serine peptidase [bacterium]